MTDPATLIDCEFCDGQMDPYEDTCSFCKKKQSRKVIEQCGIENCYDEALDSEQYCEDHLELGKTKKIKYKNILELFSDWEGYECNLCEKMLPNNHRDLARHLINEHKIEVDESE